jgi:site-specific DNA-methyltransferase (adenine-specific)/modification methylase
VSRIETIGNATLYLGDCRDILPTLGKVDAVITDPPYGIQADKGKAHSSIRDNDTWQDTGWDDSRPAAEVFVLMLAAAPRVAIWGGNYFADLLPASSGWLCWRKPEAETGFSLADVELCWTNISFAARTRTLPRRDGNEHPTQKPVALMEWTASFVPGQIVLDPFMGSGTTGVACMNLGRQFIGIEREPKYFDIACRRIEDAQRQGRLIA